MAIRQTVRVQQGRISLLEQGNAHPGQSSFVLLHGLMGTAATFLPLMDALPPERHTVAIDLPGAGESERTPHLSPRLRNISKCVGDILNALDLVRPILIGHSHGGAVALHLAASVPDRVGALALLAPAHPYFRDADQLIAFYLSPLGRMVAHTLPWYPAWVQRAGLRHMAGPQGLDSPDRLLPYRTNLRTRGTVPFLLRLLKTWYDDMGELRQKLQPPLRSPTLLLWGDHDRAVPASSAAALQLHLQAAELQLLAGIGHRPAEECPALCACLLEAWCARLASSDAGPRSSRQGKALLEPGA